MTKRNVRFLVILLLWESAWIESVTILFKETQEGKDIGRYDSGRCVVIPDAPSFFSLTIKIGSFF